MKLKPLRDRIVIKQLDPEDTTKSGLIIPESAKEKPQEGEVIAVGKGILLNSGKVYPLDVKVGDYVLYRKQSGAEVEVDDEKYLIISESDILVVLDKTESK